MNEQTRWTQRWILGVLTLVLGLAIGLTGCQATPTTEPIPTPSPPEAPVIELGDETTVEPGKTIAVRASAAGAFRYEWKLDGPGQISTQGPEPVTRYTAPEEGAAVATLTVIAHSDQGVSPLTSLIINVLPITTATVQMDTLAIPAGWMSGGTSPEPFIELESGDPGVCHMEVGCYQITYRPGGVWGGIYWWPPGCGESGTEEAWNRVTRGACGINVPEAGNLSAVKRLTFWARGEQGRERIEFRIGAADILPSPGRSLGKVTLTRDWKQYEVDLEGVNLTNAVGLFLWVASDLDNPKGAVFYLEDIRFEGVR